MCVGKVTVGTGKGSHASTPKVNILYYNTAWQGSSLDRPERGGAQPSRQAAVVGREQFRGRVGLPGPWPPRQRLTAPLQTLPALRGGRAARPNAVARDCAPPAMAGTHGAPQQSTNPATTGCPAARRACAPESITIKITIRIKTLLGSTKLEDSFQLPSQQSCHFFDTHPPATVTGENGNRSPGHDIKALKIGCETVPSP